MSQYSLKKQLIKGFTLVELLIVVIILAILAAIVVPQFASSTDDAKLSSLDTTLANMRSAIDLYYQQHGKYPGAVISSGATSCDAGTADTTGSTGNLDKAFIAQLTRYTNATGQACTGSGVNFKYGPYLKKDVLPNNAITGKNTITISTAGVLGMVSTTTDLSKGWLFDTKTGQFIADDHRLVPPSTTEYYDMR